MIILPGPDARQFTDTLLSIDDLIFGMESSGVAWIFSDLKGWSAGGGVQTSFEARPGTHGTFDAPVLRRERVIAVTGACIAETRALAEATADDLAALIADGRMGVFAVQNPVGERHTNVRLSDVPQIDWLDGVTLEWQLQFTAPDHRKYTEPQNLPAVSLPGPGGGLAWPAGSTFDFGIAGPSGRVVVTNDGTAPSEPAFTISGPLAAGFQVTYIETGQRLRYEAPVGTTVVLDCFEGTASTEGQDRESYLTVSEWFSVPPKSTATFQFAALGSETAADPAAMDTSFSSAYH